MLMLYIPGDCFHRVYSHFGMHVNDCFKMFYKEIKSAKKSKIAGSTTYQDFIAVF